MVDELCEEALRLTLESVSAYGLDGEILYANETTGRLFGLRMEEVRGQRMFVDVFADTVGSPFHAAFVRVAHGAEVEEVEHYYAPFDGWFANRIVRRGERIFIYARDVTEDVRRRRRLETLARISEVLTDDLDHRGAAQAVSAILTDVLDCVCSIAALTSDGRMLDVIGCAAPTPQTLALVSGITRFPADRGHPGDALRTRSAVLADIAQLRPYAEEIREAELRDVVERYAPTSVLVVPLIERDRPIGVLIASRGHGARALTTDDRALVSAIAPSIALYLSLAARRAEVSIARSRLASIADAIPALVAVVGRDEQYQYVNAAYERWFDVPRERIVGMSLREFLGDAYATAGPHARRALAGEVVRFRNELAYPSGPRKVDAQYLPLFGVDGTVDGMGVFVQDVTAESRISELEAEQRAAAARHAQRLESMLVMTGKLAGASRRDDIAQVLVDIDALDSKMAALWLLSEDGRTLHLARERGFEAQHIDAFRTIEITTAGPVTEAARTGRPVWVASRAEYAARFPELESWLRPDPAPPLAFAVLPLAIEGRVIGVLNFTFHDERRISRDDRTYLEVLALHASEALRRAHIYAELVTASETRAAVITASPAASIVLDEDGIVHAWNPAAERMFGWTASEVLGREHPALDGRTEELRVFVRDVIAGHEIRNQEARRMRSDGTWFDVALYGAPVRINDRLMCLSMLVDISERKRVERGRQLVADASAVFARLIDLDKTLGEVVRLPLGGGEADWCCVDLVTEDSALQRVELSRGDASEPVRRRLTHDVARAGASAAIETGHAQLGRNLSGDMLSRISVPLLLGERVLGAFSIASRSRNFDELDVSIAADLARNAAIAIENARLFEQASRARREAEDANRAKDQFLAMLGHELRNPLAPLVTALDLMRMRAPDQLPRERTIIQRQVQHLARLVDDLLDISRITRGKVELRREHIAVETVVQRAIEQVSPLLEARHHQLNVDIAKDIAVDGDPTRLAQIVGNLLSNAAKYTQPGGRIEIRVFAEADDAVIVVRDNGVGISAEMLPQIFDLFVQAPQPSARQDGGLGLGLTIVKRLVQMHGGTISAASDGPGHGTELTVRFPLAPATPVRSESPRSTAVIKAPVARRILVVDDNEDAANMLAEVLDAYGHHIRTAADGPSALRIAGDFRPEVAVLDIGLPVMDGYELAERLVATPELAQLRLIAVTGYGQEADRERALNAGFAAHLSKPVAVETLVQLVNDD